MRPRSEGSACASSCTWPPTTAGPSRLAATGSFRPNRSRSAPPGSHAYGSSQGTGPGPVLRSNADATLSCVPFGTSQEAATWTREPSGDLLAKLELKVKAVMKQALRAFILCSVVATGAAHATQATNGVSPNGISLNGVSLNGVSPNGIATNGVASNAIASNGVASNKITVNGAALNNMSRAKRDAGVSQASGRAVRCDDAGVCRLDVFRSLAGKAIGR